MKYDVDSYILEYNENENKYFISFKDSVNHDCSIEIEKEIFDTYITSKKAYTKIKNETSRHLEHLQLSDTEIYQRSSTPCESAEDIVIKQLEKDLLNMALNELTETQYRRIELHIINKVTIRDVAKLENVQKKQIEKSLQLGLKKLKKILNDRGGQI